MVEQLDKYRLCCCVAMVTPDDEPIAVGPHRVPHQMLLEQLAIPILALLIDDSLFDVFDEWPEPCLSHSF